MSGMSGNRRSNCPLILPRGSYATMVVKRVLL